MAEADKVEDDEDLRKKLWLMIAKHVIEQEKGVKRENIRKAIAFLKETNGLLKIEDILPFFPDFALIDDFKVIFLEFTCFCYHCYLHLLAFLCRFFPRNKDHPGSLILRPHTHTHTLLVRQLLCGSYDDDKW